MRKIIYYIICVSKFFKKKLVFEISRNSVPRSKYSWANSLHWKVAEVSFLNWKLAFTQGNYVHSFSFFHTTWEGDSPTHGISLFQKNKEKEKAGCFFCKERIFIGRNVWLEPFEIKKVSTIFNEFLPCYL